MKIERFACKNYRFLDHKFVNFYLISSLIISETTKYKYKWNAMTKTRKMGYFPSAVMLLPALWALSCGAYWHWMVAMPEVNSPGLVTHTS